MTTRKAVKRILPMKKTQVHNGICVYNGHHYLLCGDTVYPIDVKGDIVCIKRTPITLSCERRPVR